MQSIMEWSLTLTCDAIQSHIGQTYLTPIYNKANYLPRSQTKTLSKPEARAYYGYTSYNTNVCLFVCDKGACSLGSTVLLCSVHDCRK